MTDVLRAKQSAMAAETQVEQLLFGALRQLHNFNTQLLALHEDIRAAQPVRSGSICLELYPCGPGCTGCPHPRWVQYKWTEPQGNKPAILLSINLDAKSKDPILSLSRRTPHYQATAELIREAKVILLKRNQLLNGIRTLRHPGKA